MNKKTILTIISPAIAAVAYIAAMLTADNKNLKSTFSAMAGFMTGQLCVEIFRYITEKEEAEE